MIKKRVEYLLKHNMVTQTVYKIVMSAFFRIVSFFVPIDEHLMLFCSFGGRKFNDSPRVLFERLRDDHRFDNFHFVWAFENPEDFKLDRAESIRIDTWKYFLTALKAKVWITSVNIERGLSFKKRETIYVNTWHGAGTKLIGNACSGRKDYDFSCVDMLLVQSKFEENIFLRDFCCNPAAIRMIGFPRNDRLFHIDNEMREAARKKLHIPSGKKVILYAPTWRDSRDGGLSYEFAPPFSLQKWREAFSERYVLLFRMHIFTTVFKMQFDDFSRDASQYDDLNDILAITDVLVTDYSTIIYDAAAAGIPFICFGYDYEKYNNERGFYFDLSTEYPGGVLKTEDEVIARISKVINGEDSEKFAAFRKKYIGAGGHAADSVIRELADRLAV